MVNPGYKGKFCLGVNEVANVTSVEYDGITNRLDDASALKALFEKMSYGMANGGKITLECWLDTSDTNGQNALTAATINKTVLNVAGNNDPRLYINDTDYFELSAGAEALLERGGAVGAVDTKTGLVKTNYTLQISGGYLKLHA